MGYGGKEGEGSWGMEGEGSWQPWGRVMGNGYEHMQVVGKWCVWVWVCVLTTLLLVHMDRLLMVMQW